MGRELSFENCVEELTGFLEKNRIWVLSTASAGRVTSRAMSLVNVGTSLYFQTHESYLKHRQMQENPQVSLCAGNVSIEGRARCLGSWKDEPNRELLTEYRRCHRGSYERYGSLEGQVVWEVTPGLVSLWKYVDGEPLREKIDFAGRTAWELDFI